jgi:hypothetical protein
LTSFQWWQDRMPPETFLCMLCFEGKPIAEARTDKDGTRWDVCAVCHERDVAAVIRRRLKQESENDGGLQDRGGG